MRARHLMEYGGLRMFFFLLSILPRKLRFRAGSLTGWLFYALGIRTKTAADNLRQSGIAVETKTVRRIIRLSYCHFGRTFAELMFLDRTIWREGADYHLTLPDGFSDSVKNGAILVSAHLGNWEIMGKVLAEKGVRLAAVVHKQENPKVDLWINSIRELAGMNVIHDTDTFRIRRLLDEGYSLAMLSDQDLGQRSYAVRFFGRACRAPAGPAFLARRLNCPVWVCYSLRKDSGRFDFMVESFEKVSGESGEEFTQRFTSRFEQVIRHEPAQWFWAHKRWKI